MPEISDEELFGFSEDQSSGDDSENTKNKTISDKELFGITPANIDSGKQTATEISDQELFGVDPDELQTVTDQPDPEADDTDQILDLPGASETAEKSFQRGFGASIENFATFAENQLEFIDEDLDDTLKSTGESLVEGAGKPPEDAMQFRGKNFEWGDLLNPRYWETQAPEIFGSSVPFLGSSIIASGAAAASTPTSVGTLGTLAIQGAANTIFSAPLEASTEAGGQYKQCIAKGGTKEQCNAQATSTFIKDMAILSGSSPIQGALAFSPIGGKQATKLGLKGALGEAASFGANIGLEGAEEAAQTIAAETSANKPIDLSSPKVHQAFAGGAMLGSAFDLSGKVFRTVGKATNKARKKMSEATRQEVEQEKQQIDFEQLQSKIENQSDIQTQDESGNEFDLTNLDDTQKDQIKEQIAQGRVANQNPDARQAVQQAFSEQFREAEKIVKQELTKEVSEESIENVMSVEEPDFEFSTGDAETPTLGERIGPQIEAAAEEVNASREGDRDLAELTDQIRDLALQPNAKRKLSNAIENIETISNFEPETPQQRQQKEDLAFKRKKIQAALNVAQDVDLDTQTKKQAETQTEKQTETEEPQQETGKTVGQDIEKQTQEEPTETVGEQQTVENENVIDDPTETESQVEVESTQQQETTQQPERGENIQERTQESLERRAQDLQETSQESDRVNAIDKGIKDKPETQSFSPDTEFAVVESDQLITSFGEQFPEDALQPRVDDRTEYRRRIIRNFNPSRLTTSRKASEGAPIVSESDSFVESGNLRVDIIREIFEQNPEVADQYRQFLIDNANEFGLDPNAIQQAEEPVLVRIREQDSLSPRERVQFAREANEQTELAEMSTVEQSRIDAGRVDEGLLQKFNGKFGIDTRKNEEFVQSFIETLPPNQQDRMTDKNGNLTLRGRQRILFALMAKAFDDLSILEQFMQQGSEGFKRIFEPLGELGPRFAQVQAEIQQGNIDPNLDLAPDIVESIRNIVGIKNSKEWKNFEPSDEFDESKMVQFLNSNQLFNRDISDFTQDLIKVIDKLGGANGSKKRMKEFFENYLDLVEETADSTPDEQALLDVGRETPDVPYSAEEMVKTALRETEADNGLDRLVVPLVDRALIREIQRYAIENFDATDDGKNNFVQTVKEGFEVEENGRHGINNNGDLSARDAEVKQATGGLNTAHMRILKQIEEQEPLPKWFAQQVTDEDLFRTEQIDDQLKVIVDKVLKGETEGAEFTDEGAARFQFLVENNPSIAASSTLTNALGEILPVLEQEGITDLPSILQAVQFLTLKGGSQRAAKRQNGFKKFDAGGGEISMDPLLESMEKKEENNPEKFEGYTRKAEESIEQAIQLNESKIRERRRGDMSINEIQRAANSLDMREEDIRELVSGSVLNAEQTMLVASHLTNLTDEIISITETISDQDSVSEAQISELQDIRERRNAVLEAWIATGSEWGRAGRARQEVAYPAISQKKKIKDKLTAGKSIEELKKSEKEATERLVINNLMDKVEEGEFNVTQEFWEDLSEIVDDGQLSNKVRLQQLYDKHGEFSFDKKFWSWFWHVNIFSSLATNERNFLGNSMFAFLRVPKSFTKVGIDAVESAVTGKQREKFLSGVTAEMSAFLKALPGAMHKAGRSLWWGISPEDGLELDYTTQEPAMPQAIRRIYGWDMRLMFALDTFFRTVNGEMSLAKQAANKAKNSPKDLVEAMEQAGTDNLEDFLRQNPTEEMWENAAEEAQRGIFQSKLENESTSELLLTFGFQAIDDIAKRLEQVEGKAAILSFPLSLSFRFMKTAGNIFKMGSKMSGAGFLTSPYNAYKATKETDIKQSEKFAELSRNDLALSMVGAGASLGLLPLAMAGNVTGGGPEDDDTYREWLNQGWRPYSFVIETDDGKYTISYRYMAPFNMPIATMSNLVEQAKYNEDLPNTDKIQKAMQNVGQFYTEQSFLYGVTNWVDWLRGKPTTRNPLVSAFSGLAIPWVSLMKDFRESIDPKFRDPQTWIGEVKDQLPYFSKQLPPMEDKFGQPITQESPLGFLQPFTIPFIGEVDEDFENWQENSLLQDRIGDAKDKLKNGQRIEKIQNDRLKNWIKAETAISNLEDLDTKYEAAKLITHYANNGIGGLKGKAREAFKKIDGSGLITRDTLPWITWIIRAEQKGFKGQKLYDGDRELIWYSGRFLASEVQQRLTGSFENPKRRVKKWKQLKDFLRMHKWKQLSEEQQRRNVKELFKEAMEFSLERGEPLFNTAKKEESDNTQPIEPSNG